MAAHIALLEAADDEGVHGGAGDNAQHAALRDGSGQVPARDAHPHAALNDQRIGAVGMEAGD